MTIDLTKEELEILQRIFYNEYLRQNYLALVGEKEVPQEYNSLREKLKGDE